MTEAEKQAGQAQTADPGKTSGEAQLRTDGPTPEQWIDAGYNLKNYPPKGYTDKRVTADDAGQSATKQEGANIGSAAPPPKDVPAETTAPVAEAAKAPAPLTAPEPGASLEERVTSLEQVVHMQVGHIVGAASAQTHSILYRWWEDMKAFFESL